MTNKPDTATRAGLARAFFAKLFGQTAAVSVKVDDSRGWDLLSGTGPQDRPWSDHYQDLEDALEAWRKNFLIRRLVTLTRSYVVAGGITITSQRREVDRFVGQFWKHPKNTMDRRLGALCDELTRSGELFPVLFTNKIDGMSYVRFVPATQIRHVETDPDDYELELQYEQMQLNTTETKWWISPDHPDALQLQPDGSLPPVMLHFAVNRPIGATRGEGDLGPVLPWAMRYTHWLKDRVRLNRIRTRQALLDVEVADDSMIEEKSRQLRAQDPIAAGIYVHGAGEKVTAHNLQIGANDAKEDGHAIRLAVASGANTALHYLGEGEQTNYATAKEMGEPTARFYTERQDQFSDFLMELIRVAHDRKVALGKARQPRDDGLMVSVAEVARADNQSLAEAARSIVTALATMKANGWIDDTNATRLALKFAGETVSQEQIAQILEEAENPTDQEEEPNA